MRSRLLILAFAAVLTLSATALLSVRSAAAVGASPSAAATLSQCVQNSNSLLVVMLIDESGSLQTTDRGNERVAGVRAALAGLARLASTPIGPRRPSVQVLLTGFSSGLRPAPVVASRQWLPVTSDDVGALLANAGGYAAQNKGRDTDYGTALTDVRQLFAQRAAQLTRRGGPQPCKALIWFTDGQYSIEDRTDASAAGLPTRLSYAPGVNLATNGGGARAVSAGVRYLCRTGGLMDSLENDGVVKFTFGLSVQMPASANSFLNAVTTGAGGEGTCGSRLSSATGQYYEVNPSQLFFAFANLLQGGIGNPQSSRACARRPCAAGTSSFHTLPQLRGFIVQAATGAPRVSVALRAPDGETAVIQPGSSGVRTVAGTTLTNTWVSDQEVEISGQFQRGSDTWVGNWQYAFVDPQARTPPPVASSEVELVSDLTPSIIKAPTVLKGTSTPLHIELIDGTGAPTVSGSLVKSATVTAVLGTAGTLGSPLAVTSGAPGSFTSSAFLGRASRASSVTVTLAAHFRGTPTMILPTSRTLVLPTGIPTAEGYPTVSPPQLQLPSIAGRGRSSGTLLVTGNLHSAGCVWLGGIAIQAPSAGITMASSEPAASAASSCVHVNPGQQRRIRVVFHSSGSATGTIHASIPVMLESAITKGSRRTDIEASFVLEPTPNIIRRVGIIVALTLAGLLLPLLILWGLNFVTGLLPKPQWLVVLHQQVAVRAGELVGLDGPLQTRYGAFQRVADTGRRGRRLQVGAFSIRAVATRRPIDLFRGPVAVVRSDRSIIAGPVHGEGQNMVADEGVVPIAVAPSWYFHPEAMPPPLADGEPPLAVWGTLTLVLANGASDQEAQRLLRDAASTIEIRDWSGEHDAPGWRERLASRLGRDGDDKDPPGPPRVEGPVESGATDRFNY